MKKLESIKERKSIVDLVNPLVKQSFGEKFKGNYDYGRCTIMRRPNIGKTLSGDLHIIAKSCFLGFFVEIAGFFVKGEKEKIDGSNLEVNEEYRSAAMKYAKLYEAERGKKVTIKFY